MNATLQDGTRIIVVKISEDLAVPHGSGGHALSIPASYSAAVITKEGEPHVAYDARPALALRRALELAIEGAEKKQAA